MIRSAAFHPFRAISRWFHEHLPSHERAPQADRALDPSATPRQSIAPPDAVNVSNPQLGTADPAPLLVAGSLYSPRFLGTEAEYFREARRVIEAATPGEMLCVQMYEFQNALTNGDTEDAKSAPGYADQQALLPALASAAMRGVKVRVVLDASKTPQPGVLHNDPITSWLRDTAARSGNITIDYYPPDTVNIDHVKELVHLTPGPDGAFVVDEALTGGSNWGNHSPANDDGGAIFYGRDAMGAAQIFFRDEAFCRGGRKAPAAPGHDPSAPVQWAVTAPRAEGGGSIGILEAKIALTHAADAVYMNDFVLTHGALIDEIASKSDNAHVRLCPSERGVNEKAIEAIRKAHGEAIWANTRIDPAHMPGQKNHEKIDVYVQGGVPVALTMGSANDSLAGLDTANATVEIAVRRKINHEMDSIVHRVTTDEITADGSRYSTARFLDAALTKTRTDLAEHSLNDPPKGTASSWLES